ncbi:MAG: DUF1272 domain-containing protein [Ignavibacteria bacterium]|nr:DUF1272 domain-containing protein [Ignavibacteria bacterium]
MLELRPTCENCNISLPFDSEEAMICSFECTFCKKCSCELLKNICPNCGGELVKRPKRHPGKIEKYPASTKIVHKPVDFAKHNEMLLKKN